MKFIDEAQIKVIAGKGGNGIISFLREPYVQKGGPDGGDGGDGGSIFFKGTHNKNTLLDLRIKKTIKGHDGKSGGSRNKKGAKGTDVVLLLPIGTSVYCNDILIADIVDEKKYLIAKGGQGGKGNAHFKSSRNPAPRICENGTRGEILELTLSLKVISDIGLIGKPSAGKSTILSQISNAHPKIASYDFTTLTPQLGIVKFYDNSFVVADLPGLIKDASIGKGLGYKFLKHIERCKFLAHVIDFGSPEKNPIEDYLNIMKELEKYGHNLKEKVFFIIANKKDLPSFDVNLRQFKKHFPDLKIIDISALKYQNIEELKKIFWTALKNSANYPVKESLSSHQKKEVFISLNNEIKVKKVSKNLFLVKGDKIEKLCEKIPFNSSENFARFNKKLEQLGIWEMLKDKNIAENDVVKICNYEFIWKK